MIQVNGKAVTLTGKIMTVFDLLQMYDLDPKVVIVEQNEQIVSKGAYASARVNEGDRIEIVHFVGGG